MPTNKLQIIYRGEGVSLSEGVNIKSLAEMLENFSKVSKNMLKDIVKIDTNNLDIKVVGLKDGSLIIEMIIENIVDIISCFRDIHDFMNYVYTVNQGAYAEILEKYKETQDIYLAVENWASKHPLASGGLVALLPDMVKKLYKLCKKGNKITATNNEEIIEIEGDTYKGKTLEEAKKFVKKGGMKNILEPMTEDVVDSLGVGVDNEFIDIQQEDLEVLLGEGAEILPNFVNGEIYDFIGNFTAMQSNKGETITLRSANLRRESGSPFFFCCFPPDGKTTEDYKEFYGETILLKVTAEVLRFSLFKKPKLIIKDVTKMNPSLFGDS